MPLGAPGDSARTAEHDVADGGGGSSLVPKRDVAAVSPGDALAVKLAERGPVVDGKN